MWMVLAQENELLIKENLAPIGPAVVEPLQVETLLLFVLIAVAIAALTVIILPKILSRSLGFNSLIAVATAAILGLLLPFTLQALSTSTTVLLRAAPGSVPKNVRVLNITPNSLEVVWQTGTAIVGFVRYGADQENLEFFAIDTKGTEPITDHRVKIGNLAPNTIYYFEIVSGRLRFNDDGLPLKATTLK